VSFQLVLRDGAVLVGVLRLEALLRAVQRLLEGNLSVAVRIHVGLTAATLTGARESQRGGGGGESKREQTDRFLHDLSPSMSGIAGGSSSSTGRQRRSVAGHAFFPIYQSFRDIKRTKPSPSTIA